MCMCKFLLLPITANIFTSYIALFLCVGGVFVIFSLVASVVVRDCLWILLSILHNFPHSFVFVYLLVCLYVFRIYFGINKALCFAAFICRTFLALYCALFATERSGVNAEKPAAIVESDIC